MHTHPSAKMNLEVKAFGRSKIHYGLKLSSDFWPQGVFLCMCSISLILKMGRWRSLNPLLRRVFPSILAMIISLRRLQETKTGHLPSLSVSVVTSILEGKQEADCKLQNWSPPISCLRNCKRRLADCKCLTWSPFVSYLRISDKDLIQDPVALWAYGSPDRLKSVKPNENFCIL